MSRSTFALPLLIAAITLAGLTLALTGDGLPDAAAWVALTTPIAALAWAWRHRRR